MIQPNPKGGNLMKDTFEVPSMMTKEDVTMMILSAKKQAGLTWEGIAEKIGMSPVWIQSACMGINGFPKDKAEALVMALSLPQEAASVLE
jgi:cyanate lyase